MFKYGIYVHVPFCLSKCLYCDFYSASGSNQSVRNRYTDALIQAFRHYSPQLEKEICSSVFIGGGTPPVLGRKNLIRMIDALCRYFYIEDGCEFTVEVNPASIDRKTALALREAGVNRISVGLQSAFDNELKKLGRIHTFDQFLGTYDMLRECGFTNINVDVMYGIPDQTRETFMNTLRRVLLLKPEHISAYALQIEEGTPMHRMAPELSIPDDDVCYEMYVSLCGYLEENGYRHYEISNFAKPDYECVHNLKYWSLIPYIGFGPAAYSDIFGTRYGYKKDTDAFIRAASADDFDGITVDSEKPDVTERKREYLMLGLRRASGISKREYEKLFSADFDKEFAEKIRPYAENGFIEDSDGSCRLTRDGMYVSNSILSDIIDFGGGIDKKNAIC